jgi:VanZ family protein
MAIIFAASSQPKSAIPDFGAWDWIFKKAGHLLSYAALALAWQHGLASGHRPTLRQAGLAIVLAGLYGATDEYHQSFVAGRGASVLDVGIDLLGAALGILGARAVAKRTGGA